MTRTAVRRFGPGRGLMYPRAWASGGRGIALVVKCVASTSKTRSP